MSLKLNSDGTTTIMPDERAPGEDSDSDGPVNFTVKTDDLEKKFK